MESGNPTMEEPSVSSMFQNIAAAPDIPVYAVMVAYSKDPSPKKLNLGIGVYRNEDGKPHVLSVVKKAEQILVNDLSACKEYLPITGLSKFTGLSAELLFGIDSPAIEECRVTTVQCLSGSGALRIGADFLAKHYPKENKIVYLPQPTYANHPNFFLAAGLALRTYRYYDGKERQLDFEGLLEDLGSAPSGAIVLLQASGHNPSGADPTSQQWEQIRKLIRTKALLPFFDCAYQGLVSGDLDADAQSVRMFASDGGECLVAQSFSKTMGLYAERIGALSMVCKTSDVASRVESQLKPLIRPMYSNPPIHGAAIVSLILNNRNMFSEWTAELKAMTDRLTRVRQHLYDALEKKGTPGNWNHITRQVGMFSLLGLSEEQVAFMTNEFHIYMSSDGRANMAGLSPKTVPYLAEAIHAAIRRMA